MLYYSQEVLPILKYVVYCWCLLKISQSSTISTEQSHNDIFFFFKKQPSKKPTAPNSSRKITQSATVNYLTLFHTSGHLLQSILTAFHKAMTTCSYSLQSWENQPPLQTLSTGSFQHYQNPKQNLNPKPHSISNSFILEQSFICKLCGSPSPTHTYTFRHHS